MLRIPWIRKHLCSILWRTLCVSCVIVLWIVVVPYHRQTIMIVIGLSKPPTIIGYGTLKPPISSYNTLAYRYDFFLMLLSTIIFLPLFACLVLVFTNKTEINFIRNFSLFWSLLILNVCVTLLFFFDITSTHFQFLEASSWFSSININVVIGIDGLSLIMILLTSFLIPVCILLCWNKSLTNQAKEYSIAFFGLEAILFCVFSSLDLMLFYILFEAVLIPMYFIIGFYGSRQRRIRSSYMLFLYTLISSIIMFVSILFIFYLLVPICQLTMKLLKWMVRQQRQHLPKHF